MNIDGITAAKINAEKSSTHSISSETDKKSKVSKVAIKTLSLENKVGLGIEKKFSRKIEKLKEGFSLSKRIFLSLFSRKYEVLTKLTPFFGNKAMENLSKHRFLTDNSPQNKMIREKMLYTLNEINYALVSMNNKGKKLKNIEGGSGASFKWGIESDGTLRIAIGGKYENSPFQNGICLKKDTIEDYLHYSELSCLEQDSLKDDDLIVQFKFFNIDEKHINTFLKMKKEKEPRARQTLGEIISFLKNPKNKGKSEYKNLDKNRNFGWSIDEKGNVFIRTEETLGRGANKKFTKIFCINNGKSYAGASPNKITSKEKLEGKERLKSTLKDQKKLDEDIEAKLKKYDQEIKENEAFGFESKNSMIIQNEENLKKLKEENIPNVSPEAVATFTAKSKLGNEKKFYIYELFTMDASHAFNLDEKRGINLDHSTFIKEKRDEVYFTVGKMSKALSALHSAGKVHGDVKPLNIGLYFDENGKVNDAKLIDWDGMVDIGAQAGDCTQLYNEPNKGDGRATAAKDAYSLGATFAHILFGKEFEKFNNEENPIEDIEKWLGILNLNPNEEKLVKEILLGLLNPDSEKRMSCKDASELIDRLMILKVLNDFKNSGLDKKIIENATLLLERVNGVEYAQTLGDILMFVKNPENKNKIYSARSERGKSFGWSIDSKGNIFIRTQELLGKPGAYKKFTKVFCLNSGKVFGNAGPNKTFIKGLKEVGLDDDARDSERFVLLDFNELTIKNNENIKKLNELGIPNVPKESIVDFEIESKYKNKKIISTHKLFDSDAQYLAPEKPEPGHIQKNKKNIFLIMEKMSETLSELHKKRFYHGDVKPLNIGVNFDKNTNEINKVILFDWDDMKKIGEQCKKFGTKLYWAPECFEKGEEFEPSGAKDAFALGVTFAHFLFGGQFIENGVNPESIQNKLNELELDSDEENNALKKILLGLLDPNPENRMTCETAHSLIASLQG